MQKSPHLFVPISDRGAELFRVCLIVLVCAFFLWRGVFTVPRAGADWVSMVGPGGGRGRGGGGPGRSNGMCCSYHRWLRTQGLAHWVSGGGGWVRYGETNRWGGMFGYRGSAKGRQPSFTVRWVKSRGSGLEKVWSTEGKYRNNWCGGECSVLIRGYISK